MSDDTLVLTMAKRRIDQFAVASARRPDPSEPAAETTACEAFLKRGVDTYRWLRWAEHILREADAEGLFAMDEPARQALAELYEGWLQTAISAEPWLQDLTARGLTPPDATEFLRCHEDVVDIVERQDWRERTYRSRSLAMLDEEW